MIYFVGLSIAGIGGLASAKPNAIAIAGQDGLSVAAPRGMVTYCLYTTFVNVKFFIGTAIAGVSPDDIASLGISLTNTRSIKEFS